MKRPCRKTAISPLSFTGCNIEMQPLTANSYAVDIINKKELMNGRIISIRTTSR